MIRFLLLLLLLLFTAAPLLAQDTSTDVEEDPTADPLELEHRRGQVVDQREAVLDVGEGHAVAAQLAKGEAAQRVETTDRVEPRVVAVDHRAVEPERQVAPPGQR